MKLDREACVKWFEEGRRRSAELFDTVSPDAYTARPIPLRNPICFYEGHLPAFNINTLIKRGLGEAGINPDFEILFERGIDPEDESAVGGAAFRWPSRDAIRAYGDESDRAVRQAILEKDVVRDEDEVLRGGLAVYTILEHEPMHQETLRYMWHRLPHEKKTRPAGTPAPVVNAGPPARRMVRVPAGTATLGTDLGSVPFAWDNERPSRAVAVAEFEIDVFDVTNSDYLAFVESGGYEKEELWDEEGWGWRAAGGVRHPLFWERHGGGCCWRGMYELVA